MYLTTLVTLCALASILFSLTADIDLFFSDFETIKLMCVLVYNNVWPSVVKSAWGGSNYILKLLLHVLMMMI